MSGILLAFVGGTYSSAPANIVAPAVTGTAQARQTLSCSTGTWTGAPTPTYAYQWQYGVSNTNIPSATSSTYVISSTYVGQTIRCVVTATNSIGSSSANSNSTSSVTANVPAAPTIGTATVTGSTSASVTYTAPSDNGGATITTYTATSSPGGITGTLSTSGSGTITVSGLTTGTAYTFTVTATNSVGTSAASAASNSITPAYLGFLSMITGSGANNEYYATGLRNDSSGVNYLTVFPSGASSIGLMKVSTSGAITYQAINYGPQSAGNYGAFYIDSSNNYYLTGTVSGGFATLKFNSSDTHQWTRRLTETGSGFTGNYFGVTTDSSNNVYVLSDIFVDIGCCSANDFLGIRKLDSSGAVTSGTVAIDLKAVNNSNLSMGVHTDSSNNVYCVADGKGSGNEAFSVMKLNSSLAISSQGTFYVSGGVQTYGSCFDQTNTVGYICGRRNTALILKYDSSCARSWSYELTSMYLMTSCAIDSSGNVYGVGYESTNNTLCIVKINSSGTLQWARKLSNNNTPSYLNPASSISISGSRFTVALNPATALFSPVKLLVFSAPTDGTGTGSFSNSGKTWTYASYSETLTSLSMTTATAMTLTTQTTSNTTLSAPTLTTTTATASVTQF